MTKVYTKTGDKGETSLFTGERLSKCSPFFEALGGIDECNCAIGMAVCQLKPLSTALERTAKELWIIQNALFDLGAAVATPSATASERNKIRTRFDAHAITLLEHWIDHMEQHLPPLHTFILPGGHPAASALHLARAVCRRSERALLKLIQENQVDPALLIYLNRLSDYLFVAARFVNASTDSPEVLWQLHQAAQETNEDEARK